MRYQGRRCRNQRGRHFNLPIISNGQVAREELRKRVPAAKEGFLEYVRNQWISVEKSRISGTVLHLSLASDYSMGPSSKERTGSPGYT